MSSIMKTTCSVAYLIQRYKIVSQKQDLDCQPINVAFGIKPRYVEPCGRPKFFQLLVISYDIAISIVRQWPKIFIYENVVRDLTRS